MEKPITVDYMLDLCKKMSDAGYGDMIFRCGDDIIHKDELGINYMAKEVKIRGMMYNHPMHERVTRLLDDIEKAKNRYYYPEMTEEMATEKEE